MIVDIQMSVDGQPLLEYDEEAVLPLGIYARSSIDNETGTLSLQLVNKNGVPFIGLKKNVLFEYTQNIPEKEGILKRIKRFIWRGKN
jgi:hypothetical protein